MNGSGFEIKNTECKKLLGIKVCWELKLQFFLVVFIQKGHKINALDIKSVFVVKVCRKRLIYLINTNILKVKLFMIQPHPHVRPI